MYDAQYSDKYFGEEMKLPTSKPIAINDNRFVAIEEHLYSDLNGEAVILSMKSGKYYGLNGVGRTIWNAIRDPARLAEIQTCVMREYEVDESTCCREVESFLQKMLDEELIEILDEKDL
jgi:hypothetical protein